MRFFKNIKNTITKNENKATWNVFKDTDAINKMSKYSCMNIENKCNSGFVPYSESDFTIYNNPITKLPYTSDEKDDIRTRYSEKCKLSSHDAKRS